MKVAILYDVEGWAYHAEARGMAKYVGSHGIQCDLFRYTNFYSDKFKSKRKQYDVVYLFPRQAGPMTFDPKKTIVKFSSFGDFRKQEELNSIAFPYIVCTNKTILERAASQIGDKTANLVYLPLCIDHKLFYPKNNIKRVNSKLVVGFAGNAQRKGKGFDLIEQAAKELGDLIEFKAVTYHKDRLTPEQMPDFYRSLDLLVCMSTAEGGPLTAFEAGMCGTPTISGCDKSAINESTIHNYNGFHIERDVESLKKEIIRLSKNKKLVLTAKSNIAKTMYLNHSWITQSRIYAEMIREVGKL